MTYTVLRILTYVLGIVGSALVIPLGVAIFENEDAMIPVFLAPMVLAWGAALIFLLRARGKPKVVGIQDAFGVVGILWVAICVFGAIPLYFCGGYLVSFIWDVAYGSPHPQLCGRNFKYGRNDCQYYNVGCDIRVSWI